jgi:O-antigen/teichoic acid export membrane protein
MKDLLKKSTLYTLLGFMPTAVNFFLLPLILTEDYMPANEYGLVSMSMIFQGIIVIFMNFGLDAAFARFYFNVYKKRKLLHAYYSTVLLSVIVFSAMLFGILFFTGDALLDLLFRNDRYDFSHYGIATFLLAFSTILYSIILSYYRDEENLRAYAFISISVLVLSVLGILIGVIGFNKGAYGNIIGRAAGPTIVVTVYLLWYFSKRQLIIRWKYLRAMLKYGIPFVPYLVILMMNANLDLWMTEHKFPIAQLGEYNLGVQLASLVSVFIYAVFNAISPRMYRLLAEKDTAHDREILNLNKIFHYLVVLAIVGELAIIAPVTTMLIPDDAYHGMLSYIPLLIVAWLPHLYYMLFVIPIMFYHKTRYLPVITVVGLGVGLTSNLLLIPVWGVYGVCASAIVIKVVTFVLTWFVSRYEQLIVPQHYSLGKNHLLAAIIFVAAIGVFGYNEITGQQYRVWINTVPLLIFLVYSAVAFRKELNIVLTLFMKRKGKA